MTEFRRALKLARRLLPGYKPSITKLWIEVTDRCNSQCRNCNIWNQPHIENPLTPNELFHVLKDPVFKDVDYIINSGGEPTVRDDLLWFLWEEHRALPNATIQLSTNGLNPDKVIHIVKNLLYMSDELKMEIGTSLDGIGIDHDRERRIKGNYESVIRLIDQLISLRDKYGRDRLKIGFGTVVTDRTIDSIPALRSYADEKGIGMLLQWFNQSSFYSNIDRTGLDTGRRRMEVECKLIKDADYTILSDLWCNYLEGKPYHFNCMALRSFCIIKCNGDIVPCLSMWGARIGNVRRNKPSDILTGECYQEPWFNPTESIRDTSVKYCEGCLNSWATYWSFEADPIQYVKYFIRHPIKLVKKLCG